MNDTNTNASPATSLLPGGARWKMHFMEPDDLCEPWGRIRAGAEPLRLVDKARGLLPGTVLRECVPQPDGSWMVYGYVAPHNVKNTVWHIMRYRTCDGITFQDMETVYTSEPGHWYGTTEIVRNPEDNSFLCLKWGPGAIQGGHALWAFGSRDGAAWKRLSDKPVYHDHDAFSACWDAVNRRYLVFQATYQKWNKPFKDNAGTGVRRVLHFRSSRDGVCWEPSGDFTLKNEHAPDASLVVPDGDDPPELEFYSFTAFPYADRFVGMMLNYLPGPQCVWGGGHGPHNGGEWWVGRGGRSWKRPYRDIFAPGPASGIIQHAPITVGGMHLWVIGREVYGLPEDCVFYAGSLSNSAFSTRIFEAPSCQLVLKAALGAEGRGFRNQSYIMAEALDEQGKAIEGYEKENCVIRQLMDPHPLRWGYPFAKGSWSLAGLAGRKIRLRFHLRDARIYAITQAG